MMIKKLLKILSIACGILFVISIMVSFFENELILTIFSTILTFVLIAEIVVLIIYFIEKRKQNPKPKKPKEKYSNKKPHIVKVQVLGTRQGEETGILATWNFTVYSLLVLYDNGTKDVIECASHSKLFKDLIQYMDITEDKIKVIKSSTSTGDEIESLEIIDDD